MKVKEVKLNTKEISNQLLKGEAIVKQLESVAKTMAQKAGDGYKANTYVNGKYRANVSVYPESNKAIDDNSENNTLLKVAKS